VQFWSESRDHISGGGVWGRPGSPLIAGLRLNDERRSAAKIFYPRRGWHRGRWERHRSGGEVAHVAEGGEIAVANHDMVEYLDFEELAGADKVAGHADVAIRRRAFAAGVVVHDDDGAGGGGDGQPEDFAGMHQNGVGGAQGDELMSLDAAAGVQEQDGEAFAIGVEVGMGDDMAVPIVGGFVGGVTLEHGGGGGTFAQGGHLEFVGGGGKAEGLHDGFQTGKGGGVVHGVFLRSGGLTLGGKIAAVTLAGVIVGAFGGNRAARVLPCLAGVVPVKAQFGQLLADVGGGNLGKLNPNPFADDFGKGKAMRGFAAEQGNQAFGGQGAIDIPAGEVDFGEWAVGD